MTALRVDAAFFPQPATDEELRVRMPKVWAAKAFAPVEPYVYPNPAGQYAPGTAPETGPPGSDPQLAARHLFGEDGVDVAVALPLTRGLNPDIDLSTQLCKATNTWLAETWLEPKHDTGGRFVGSIRVNPQDPEAAVAEIERLAGHPGFVQIAVPMEAHEPYGKRRYLPIWAAAAEAGLPVAVHVDGGAGVEYWPSPVGYFAHHVEYSIFAPLTFFYHLGSLIAEGVFDRFDNLTFVFADGGGDNIPFMWRMDERWRAMRYELPWVKSLPTDYLRQHARFCTSRLEGPTDADELAAWCGVGDAQHLWLYASHYPHWQRTTPDEMNEPPFPAAVVDAVFGETAACLYGLADFVPARPGA